MRRIYYNKPPEWVNLSVDATPSASMTIRTTSGMPYVVDWGDGTIDVVNSNVLASHTYTSPFTGNVRVSAFGGLSDIYYFLINNNIEIWSFDADVLSAFSLTALTLIGNLFTGDMSSVGILTSLTALQLNGNLFTGDMSGVGNLTSLTTLRLQGNLFTGDMSGVVNLTSLTYLRIQGSLFTGDMSGVVNLTSLTTLYLNGNLFTGDMSGVVNLTSLTYLEIVGNSFTGDMSGVVNLTSLTYLEIVGNFTINYTSTTFAPNFQRWYFRPTTADNPMSSLEIDQMLADAAQTTWTGNKDIYVDGNNGVRTSASDADVATLQAMGVTLYLNV